MLCWRSQAKYSKSNQDTLDDLGRVHLKELNLAAPADWTTSNQRPTHFVPKGRYAAHVQSQKDRMNRSGKFYNQASVITDIIANYITERRSRWMGSGAPGDPLEQCFDELLEFSTKELSHYGYDRESLEKIQQRIRYLEYLIKNQAIFKPGIITRKNNKFKALNQIRQQLRSCESLAKKEVERGDTRKKLEACINDIPSLLLCFFRYVYYARDKEVHKEVFIPENFAKPNTYPLVKASHTGAMLNEALSLTGLDSLNVSAVKEEKGVRPFYFDKDFNGSSYEPQSRNSNGIPPWLESQKDLAASYLLFLQNTFGGIRLAPLKNILSKAANLIKKEGELWVYGKEPGKLCLEGLLDLLEQELNAFKTNFLEAYEFQDERRYESSKTISDAVKNNFVKADEEKKNFLLFHKTIMDNIQELRRMMAEFTEEEAGKVQELRTDFYESLKAFVIRFNPSLKAQFQLKEKRIIRALENENFNLDQPLKDQDTLQRSWFDTALENMFPGEKFEPWRKKYLERHAGEYSQLKKLLREFENSLNEDKSKKEKVQAAATAIRTQLQQMHIKAKAERPAWRLSLRKFSLGWPFRQSSQHHLDRIIEEFNLIREDVQRQENEAVHSTVITVQEESKQTTTRPWVNTNKRKPLKALYKDDKNTLFNINVQLEDSNSPLPLDRKAEEGERFKAAM